MQNYPPDIDQLEHAASAGDELAGVKLASRLLEKPGDEELLVPGDYTTGHVHGGAERQNFDGSGRAFGALTSDSLIRCIKRRIADLSGRPVEVIEPSSVIRYQPGQQYHLHVDYFTACR